MNVKLFISTQAILLALTQDVLNTGNLVVHLPLKFIGYDKHVL